MIYFALEEERTRCGRRWKGIRGGGARQGRVMWCIGSGLGLVVSVEKLEAMYICGVVELNLAINRKAYYRETRRTPYAMNVFSLSRRCMCRYVCGTQPPHPLSCWKQEGGRLDCLDTISRVAVAFMVGTLKMPCTLWSGNKKRGRPVAATRECSNRARTCGEKGVSKRRLGGGTWETKVSV